MAKRSPGLKRGRRQHRTPLTGPFLKNPEGRVALFRKWATAMVGFLQHRFPNELGNVTFAFASAPLPHPHSKRWDPDVSPYYEINREAETIFFYRVPIQKFKRLHRDDEVHRRLFVEHIVYRAACDYLEVPPWELMPGYFDHF